MYLSRVQIDTDNRRKMQDLTHLGAYHSWVEDSFPEEKELNIRTRKLWRIDRLYGKNYLLIVSQEKPERDRFEKYGVAGTAETKKYDPYLEQIHNGKRYVFKATLNPTHSVSRGEGKRGRVYPEITEKQQMEFLAKRASANGFSLGEKDYYIAERGYSILRKAGECPVRLCRATYEGTLTVTDEDLFRKALTKGIGRKKAYGFGMMTVIPEV